MSAPRGLSPEEQAAWEKLAETVTPLRAGRDALRMAKQQDAGGRKQGQRQGQKHGAPPAKAQASPPPPKQLVRKPALATHRRPAPPPPPPPVRTHDTAGLDSHWDRRFKSGSVAPDLTLDLHGHGLDAAYTRLMRGVAQARAMGARTILVVTGKPRPVDPADRGERRGAIRAKLLDWLAASEHSEAISAIRKAHRHHGGDGALYIVLKRG